MTGKYFAENLKVKDFGVYETKPDGTYRFDGGVVGGIYVSDKVVPLSPQFLASAQRLANNGFENYTQAEIAAKLRGGLGETIEKINNGKVKFEDLDDGVQEEILKITSSPHYTEVMEKNLNQKMKNPYLYIDFGIIRNYFRYSGTPQATQKVIDYERANVTERMSRGFRVTMDHVIMVIMLIMVFVIAYYILQMGGGETVKQAAESITQATGSVGKSAGGINVK
ncbi:MAG: hypothetical protein J7K38_00735 [Thermoplasmata archaeon]|nr:hypothetical protein [Thermoplasmata archaeon]